MLTRLARWLSVVVLALAATAAGAAEPRVAVVVGNSAYENRPLLNPRNDARQVASSLRELGFSTVLLEDASRDDLRRVPDAIKGSFPRGSVGLFYYAGHALQHRGLNYLLPVDFQLSSSDELPREATLVDDILEAMHAAGVKLALVVLDACRDNPFGRPEEALGPGLAAIERAPGETLIAYATSAGAVASDGLSGNSPFTAALVTALERPGLDVYDVFRMVRGFVREATEGQQIPWVSGSIESNFVFREARVVPAVATGEVGVPTMYWASIESSIDPGDFRRFMTAYPQHPLASEARTREQTLVAQGSPTTPLPDFASIVPEAGPTEVTPCDVAASKPGDMRRVAEGVPSGLVNTRLALRVCAEALADDPANPRLLFQLGRVLDIAGRLDEARKLYEQAAEQEYPAAMGNLAYAYWVGRGLTPDLGKTAELTRRAADLGLLGARNLLGTLYIRGNGVPESAETGFRWVRLAADDGWMNALDQLGNLYRRGQGTAKDDPKAYETYLKAAQLGSSNAMNNIARMLREGEGVTKDLPASLEWYGKAIDAGNAYAPRQLAEMYRKGWGVKKDAATALRYYRLAAERGFVEAYADVAAMYEAGDGAPKDATEAYFHYRLAREAGLRREQRFSLPQADEGISRLEPRLSAEARAGIDRRLEEELARIGPVPALGFI